MAISRTWLFGIACLGPVLVLGQSGCEQTAPPPPQPAPRPQTKPQANPQNDDAAATRHAPKIQQWHYVDDLPRAIAQFETVFWERQDTVGLRKLIRDSPLVKGRRILEIGTGTGVVALCCLQAGAAEVVATDINPTAVANARYNAMLLGFEDRLDVRVVAPDNATAYAVIEASEMFDLVISNPPWEDQTPERIDDHAFFDPGFELLQTLLGGLRSHLEPHGRALLAYGCVTAVRRAEQLAAENDLSCRRLDDRALDELPEVFLPGMLLEIVPRERSTD